MKKMRTHLLIITIRERYADYEVLDVIDAAIEHLRTYIYPNDSLRISFGMLLIFSSDSENLWPIKIENEAWYALKKAASDLNSLEYRWSNHIETLALPVQLKDLEILIHGFEKEIKYIISRK
jgi:hypothetical protein